MQPFDYGNYYMNQIIITNIIEPIVQAVVGEETISCYNRANKIQIHLAFILFWNVKRPLVLFCQFYQCGAM